MSMSTRIEDLPGGLVEPEIYVPDNIQDQLYNLQNQMQQQQQQEQQNIEPQNYQQNIGIKDTQNNNKMNVKKKVRFNLDTEDDEETVEPNENFFSFLKSQVSEENLLLLIVLMLSSRTELDHYIKFIYRGDNSIIFTLIKCVILIVAYMLVKKYILPKIKI